MIVLMRETTRQDDIKRILVLDDDRDYRNLLRTYLARYLQGSELVEYDPVAQGAPPDDFDWAAYDILILDYYLCIYGLTGLDLLQKNRKKPGFPAAIMLTGAGDEEVAVRALNFGVYQYLRKEKLSKEELIAAIHTAFNTHQEEMVKRRAQERINLAFDKTLFYRHLERPPATATDHGGWALLLIDVDAADILATESGFIVRDNLLRYLARRTYEKLNVAYGELYITRIADSAIGVVIPNPGSMAGLQNEANDLCTYFNQEEYLSGGKPVAFTTSTGILFIDQEGGSAALLIALAGQARDLARRTAGNSCHMLVLTEILEQERQRQEEEQRKLEQERHRQEEEQRKAEEKRQQQIELEKQRSEDARRKAEQEYRRAQEQRRRQQAQKLKEGVHRRLEEARKRKAEEKLRQEEETRLRRETGSREKEPLPPETQISAEPETEIQPREIPVATKAAAETDRPVTASADEIVVDESELDKAALGLKKAFDENRTVLTFQPVVAMFAQESGSAADLFKVNIQLIDDNSDVVSSGEIRKRNTVLSLQQFMDRWILREMTGRIVNNDDLRTGKIFIIPISEAWLTDITLFNWLKKLLTGVELVRPGRSIMLEVPVSMLMSHEKRAVALIKALKKSHGFRIALGDIKSADEAQKSAELFNFNLYTIEYGLMEEFHKHFSGNLESLKKQGARIVIDNIEDATMLTEAISHGADYVMGDFVGTAETYITGSGNIETFDIS